MGKALGVLIIILSTYLVGCGGYIPPNQPNLEQLNAQKKQELADDEKNASQALAARIRKQKENKKQFEMTHPEVELEKIQVTSENTPENNLGIALNNLGLVTRHPDSPTSNDIYVKVGDYELTLKRIQLAITGYADECKRVSAYSNFNYSVYKATCVSDLSQSLNDFSNMLKDKSIPDKTKSTALGEASYDSEINFEHAARLAYMHTKLCKQQGNRGYVAMVTVAAPCGGQGDVLNISTARKIGAL